MVPVAGVEPARYRYHGILSPARLPIPSHRHIYNVDYYTITFFKKQDLNEFFVKILYINERLNLKT